MFSKRVWLTAAILVCILGLLVVAFVQAQNGQRGTRQMGPQDGQRPMMEGPVCPVRLFGPPRPQMMERLAAELQLTEEQRNQATKLVGALDARIKQIVADTNLMRDLIAELKSEGTKPDKVKELGVQLSKQEGEILQAELAMWVKYEQMLTPEQRTKFWSIFPRQPQGPMGPPPGMGPGGPGAPGGPGEPPPPPPAGN